MFLLDEEAHEKTRSFEQVENGGLYYTKDLELAVYEAVNHVTTCARKMTGSLQGSLMGVFATPASTRLYLKRGATVIDGLIDM